MPAIRPTIKALRVAACAAAAVIGLLSTSALAAPQVLSSEDAALYQSAFTAARAGDFKTADKRLDKVTDRSLAGYVEFERLMHPRYTAKYEELSAWLTSYGDLPGAERIYALAQKRKPATGDEAIVPRVVDLLRVVAEKGLAIVGAPSPLARNAFYSGDAATAYKLAAKSSERWIAGLSAFRLGLFDEAQKHFDEVAIDPREDEWLRAGAAYWAARAVIAVGRPEMAPAYLSAAAQKPWTFYGMLAEAQLGLEPTIRFSGPLPYQLLQSSADTMTPMLIKAAAREISALRPASPQADCSPLIASSPRARRAAALLQLGRTAEASQEITVGMAEADSEDASRQWDALGQDLNAAYAPGRAQAAAGFDPADYPLPVLQPKDGFTIDPALVYAIVRQESRFNPDAVSPVGARGLMQIMPATAALTSGDESYKKNAKALADPSTNLRLGQDYFAWLLQRGVGDDILAAVAAYNAGPGNLLKTQQQLGADTDALMMIESLPAAETRNYVERVMAGYWLYRRQLGAATASLDALANGARQISVNLEQAVVAPQPPAVIEQADAAVKF